MVKNWVLVEQIQALSVCLAKVLSFGTVEQADFRLPAAQEICWWLKPRWQVHPDFGNLREWSKPCTIPDPSAYPY